MARLGKIITGVAASTILGPLGPLVFTGPLVISGIKKDKQEKRIKEARESGFRDGVNEGKARTAAQIEKFTNFYLATASLSYYVARCDGSISEEEKLEIDYDLDAIRKNCDMPDWVKNKIKEIEKKEDISWNEVKMYLDKVGIDTLIKLEKDVDEIIEASDGVLAEEELVRMEFNNYLRMREKSNNYFYDNLLSCI